MSVIPILNGGRAPMRAFGAYIMAMVKCECRPTNGPMLIRGHDLVVTCPLCGSQYGIVSVRFDRDAGDESPTLEVGQLIARSHGSS